MNSARKTELKAKAAQFAAGLRDELHLMDLMPLDVDRLLRDKGVQALFRPMADNSSGMAIRTKSSDGSVHRFMMVNTGKALGHQRFTVCHELYHLLYQEEFNCVRENTASFDDSDPEEYTADWFASYLILPKGALERLVPVEDQRGKVQLATLLKIEQSFLCSRSSLLFRLKDLGWIDGSMYSTYALNVKKGALSYGYPTALYEPTDAHTFVGDYNLKARRLFDEGKISYAKLVSLLKDIGLDLNAEAEDHGEL